MSMHDIIKDIPKKSNRNFSLKQEIEEVGTLEKGYDCKGVKYIKKELKLGKDITNKRNNRLIALFPVELPNKDYSAEGVFWLCLCDCGNLIVVNGRKLKPGSYESCGCLAKERHYGQKLLDLTGQIFGRLIVLCRDFNNGFDSQRRMKHPYWWCLCECGTIKSIRGDSLKSGAVKSCGCYRLERVREENGYNLIGERFYRLLVKEAVIINNCRKWKCICNCGNETIVDTNSLISGHTKSCGCLQKDLMHERTIDITGQRFGMAVAIKQVENKNGSVMWLCKCDCGNEFVIKGTELRYRQFVSCGCMKSIGEQKIIKLLINNNIHFETQKRFETCRNPKTNNQLIFDFYINDNFLLEYDGIQHFKSSTGWNNEQHLLYTKERDEYKNQWCRENNIPLKRIPYWELENITIENIMDDTFLII